MEGKATFFGQLRSLCTDVEARLKVIKQEVSRPPGRAPHKYDEGLNRFKTDIQELKKQSEEIRERVVELNRFHGYLKDARQLVEEQAAGTHKMEMYCAQYGYVIPKIDLDTPFKVKVTTPNGTTGDVKGSLGKSGGGGSLQVTPELNVCTQLVMKGKRPPVLTTGMKTNTESSSLYPETPSACMTPSKIPLAIKTPTTPRTPKTPFTPKTPKTPFTPGPKPYMMMEQWMTGTAEDFPTTHDTPDTERNSETAGGMETGEEGDIMQTPTQTDDAEPDINSHSSAPGGPCNAPCSITTPTEPMLSSLTTLMLAGMSEGVSKPVKMQITTPEEPVLHTQHISVSVKNSYDENRTPEEPMLHYKNCIEEAAQQEMPEDPVLSYQSNMPYGWKGSAVPKEPVLSYQRVTSTTPTQNPTYRRPRDARMFTPHTEMKDDNPCTPELSDMTKSLLTRLALQAPSQLQQEHRKEHEEHEHPHRSLQEPPQPHREIKASAQLTSELRGMSWPRWNQQGASLPCRSIIGASQLHKGASQPHHQSFSAAMNKLNTTWDDENAWGTRDTQHPWTTGGRDRPVGDKVQATVDPYLIDDVPLSPQLSDITQRIIGQLRR
ncbi:proteoglycan 4-like [Scylla paramamosain]|uniref:proteoglycan 4-like n=1 Tax=Scylla paramamosain TaxID=85552 RepID=UPI0030836D93